MKETTVKFPKQNPTGYLYQGTDFVMTWAKKSDDENFDFEPCYQHVWNTCRETLAANYTSSLQEGLSSFGKVPKDKLRILIMCVDGRNANEKRAENWYNWIKSGVRILNMLESEVGWALTKVMKITNKDLMDAGKYGVVVVASPRWLKATQLMSMFLLILRSAKKPHIKSLKKIENISKMVEALSETAKSGDALHVKNTANSWLKIMRHSSELFKTGRENKLYQGNHGIMGMLSKTHNSMYCTQEMRERWKELNEKYES